VKLIPCPRCRQTAIGQTTAAYPGGAPVVFGRFTGGTAPIVVKCLRCTGSFKLDAKTFAGIPEMTPAELKEWGLDGRA
jgi:hypothetical protein